VKANPLIERFAVGVDVQGYSARNTRSQQVVQRHLVDMLVGAAAAAQIKPKRWARLPGGDGELAVLPPDVDLAAVVGRFVAELNSRLAEHNDDHSEQTQIRLRVAMHSDAIVESAYEYAGPALVVLSRLLDSRPVRSALARSRDIDGAELALIVSEPVYRKVVLSGLGGIRTAQFRQVAVDIPDKGFSETAYLHVPRCDVNALSLDDDREPPQSPPSATASEGLTTTVATLYGGVSGETVNIANIWPEGRRGRR
jgi:hypothetical protein